MFVEILSQEKGAIITFYFSVDSFGMCFVQHVIVISINEGRDNLDIRDRRLIEECSPHTHISSAVRKGAVELKVNAVFCKTILS